MKVDIDQLRVNVALLFAGRPHNSVGLELNEALNELETRRSVERYCDEEMKKENTRLRNDLTRITEIKDRQVRERRELEAQVAFYQEERANCECDPLNEPSFAKWFAQHHPETIESITITLRKKED